MKYSFKKLKLITEWLLAKLFRVAEFEKLTDSFQIIWPPCIKTMGVSQITVLARKRGFPLHNSMLAAAAALLQRRRNADTHFAQ
jgi:hypothetical protein